MNLEEIKEHIFNWILYAHDFDRENQYFKKDFELTNKIFSIIQASCHMMDNDHRNTLNQHQLYEYDHYAWKNLYKAVQEFKNNEF